MASDDPDHFAAGRPIAYEVDPRVALRDLGWRRGPMDEEMDSGSVDAIMLALDVHDLVCDRLFADLVLMLLLHAIVKTQPEAVNFMVDIMNIHMLA